MNVDAKFLTVSDIMTKQLAGDGQFVEIKRNHDDEFVNMAICCYNGNDFVVIQVVESFKLAKAK